MVFPLRGAGQIPEQGEARLGEPRQPIPIIIVPGIMGSRLVLDQSRNRGTPPLIWNPRGGMTGDDAGDFAGVHDTLRDIEQRCTPDEGHHPFEGAEHRTAAGFGHHVGAFDPFSARGTLYNLISDYHGLARALKEDAWLNGTGYRPRVFCCGYDWRRSNAESASQRLSSMVTMAREVTHSDKVIIVAHSMGGLVSRSFSRNAGGEGIIQAMFLLGSPSLGAPESFFTLKHGIENPDDFSLRQVALSRTAFLPFTRRDSRELIRRIPAAYELLPNEVYGRKDASWLSFEQAMTGYPTRGNRNEDNALSDCSDPRKLYTDIYTGIADGAIASTGDNDETWEQRRNERGECARLVSNAMAFQETLLCGERPSRTVYMHPRTYFVHSNAVSTIVKARLVDAERNENRFGRWFFSAPQLMQGGEVTTVERRMEVPAEDTRAAQGDKTVPTISAKPDADLCNRPPVGEPVIAGRVDHMAMPSSAWVIRYLKRQIRLEVERMAREAR